MLARRLAPLQPLAHQLGTIARYVTDELPANLRSQPSSPSSSRVTRIWKAGKRHSEKPQADTKHDGTAADEEWGRWHLRKKAGSKHPGMASVPRTLPLQKHPAEPHNPLSWENYLQTEAEIAMPCTGYAENSQWNVHGSMRGAWSIWDGLGDSEVDSSTGRGSSNATVLSLSGLSKSLLEADFYRLAPQGQHMDGWTSSIQRIIQLRNTATKEPLGQYFLFFASYTKANAYLETLKRLHRLARQVLPGKWREEAGVPFRLHTDGDEHAMTASARDFTILPPSIQLRAKLHTASTLRDRLKLFQKEVQGRTGITGRRRDLTTLGCRQTAERILRVLEASDWGGDRGPVAKRPSHKVLLRLEGSSMTAQDLWRAIERDGREHNLLWPVLRERWGVVPIAVSARRARPRVSEGVEDGGQDRAKASLFTRFTVDFEEAAEARRFVRAWHRRELWDSGRERAMVVNATAIS